MTAIDEYVRHNRGSDPAAGGVPAAPAHKVAILTCMDARVDPVAMLGIASGDAHVLRNAGGVVTQDVIRSLAMSQNLLGTRDVMIVQHTNCGMSQMDEESIHDRISQETGSRPDFATHAFSDLEVSLRGAAERIRRSPYLTHTGAVRTFIYDVDSGRLTEVPPAQPARAAAP